MGNKLKRLLEHQEPTLQITLSYNKIQDMNDFESIVNEVGKTGIPQKVPTPQSIEVKKSVGDYQYPLKTAGDIVDLMVYPALEPVSLPVFVDGNECEYKFWRSKEKQGVRLESMNSEVVDVSILFRMQDNTANLTYATHPENADSIEELIQEYKLFLALLDTIFQKSATLEELEDMRKFFSQSLKEFNRAKEISRILEINLTPKSLIAEDNKEGFIEKTYLLLVQKSIIRQNDKLNPIGMPKVDNIKPGQQLFAVFSKSIDLEIFGEHRVVYTVNCVFGAEIQKIEEKENGDKIVYFKDSETNPMYRAYSAFLDEKEAEEEIKCIMEKREQYEHAISWADQLHDLLQS